METIADILLVAGALDAGIYCFVLARRLARFNDLENGIGGAVAVLSVQVDDLTRALAVAQKVASDSSGTLDNLTERAETVAGRLEILVASLHDAEEPRTPPVALGPNSGEPIFTRHGRSDRTGSP